MIAIKIIGGLGNQLFEYATARALARRTNQELTLDRSAYAHYSLHAYALDRLGIVVPRFGALNSRRLHKNQPVFSTRFPFLKKLRTFRESSLLFDPQVLSLRDVFLDGYWQSEKYFIDDAAALRKEIFSGVTMSPESVKVNEEIGHHDAISLHIRRGDYVQNKNTQEVHGSCDLGYYHDAINRWLSTRRPVRPKVFAFSDDPSWVQTNLKLDIPVRFVDHNDANRNFEDLWLMSRCQHHIIANSSFSWWGAWLNPKSDKFVAAPRQWFKDSALQAQSTDIVPSGWERF